MEGRGGAEAVVQGIARLGNRVRSRPDDEVKWNEPCPVSFQKES